MIDNNSWHHNLLATTAIGIGIVTIYSFVNSSVGNRPVANFSFPQEIPLSSWKHLNRETINIDETDSAENQSAIQSAKRYRYQKQDARLDIEMYYLTDTRGDVDNLLVKHTSVTKEILENRQIKQRDNNYYSLVKDSDRTYLSSCLNATGDSTVTAKQFSSSLNQRPLNLELLGNWLLGKESIRDRRCLWITISTPNQNSSWLENSAMLETVWQNWHQWWQPHFPNL